MCHQILNTYVEKPVAISFENYHFDLSERKDRLRRRRAADGPHGRSLNWLL